MNYKFLLFLFSISLMIRCSDEQTAEPTNASTYIKFFGASNSDIAYVARQTSDQGYILLGTTEIDNEGVSVFKIKVIKVDINGNTLWQKVYPDFLPENEDYQVSLTGRSIISVEDGYIIVGDSVKSDRSTKTSLFIMKINDSANDNSFEKLALNYQNNAGVVMPYDLHGIELFEDSDGNIRVISDVTENDQLIGSWLLQINPNLTFDFNQNYSYNIKGKLQLTRFLHEAADGDFVFGGTSKIHSIDNAILRKVPAYFEGQSGASTSIISSPENHYTVGQIIATNIGYAIVGTHLTSTGDSDVFFVLLHSDGTPKTEPPIIYNDTNNKFTGIGSKDEEGLTIANTSDGGFIIGGLTLTESAGGKDILLIKIDHLGNIQWTKTIGNENQEHATHIQEDKGGGYLIFGNTEFGGINTMVLIKTDKNGNVN